jgi:hypothetical protein
MLPGITRSLRHWPALESMFKHRVARVYAARVSRECSKGISTIMTGFSRPRNAPGTTDLRRVAHVHVGCWFWICSILLVAGTARGADLQEAGPLSLIMTYHATPANRLALRQQLESTDLRRFQQWKDQGILSRFSILSNRHIDSGTWDAAVLLTFADSSAAQRWRQVERDAPAGLSPKTLELTTSIETAPADLVRKHDIEPPRKDPVFMVLPYEVFVSTDAYLAYLDGYVIPQLEGWIAEGVLAGYDIYLPRYPAGRPWASLLVLEYENDRALGRREAIVAKVRARLKENPDWKALSDDKKKVREEKQAIIADPVQP